MTGGRASPGPNGTTPLAAQYFRILNFVYNVDFKAQANCFYVKGEGNHRCRKEGAELLQIGQENDMYCSYTVAQCFLTRAKRPDPNNFVAVSAEP